MRELLLVAAGAVALLLACQATDVAPTTGKNVRRYTALRLSDVKPERFIPDGIDQRADSVALRLPSRTFDTDEEGQRDSLPMLPFGTTVETLRDGDRLYHGKGGCLNCHGAEAEGLAARGKTLTAGLRFIPVGDLDAIDSTIRVGMQDGRTRSPVAMPPRGQFSDLDATEMRDIAAYVWAISQVKGEPWAGGHAFHASHDWRASARTSIP